MWSAERIPVHWIVTCRSGRIDWELLASVSNLAAAVCSSGCGGSVGLVLWCYIKTGTYTNSATYARYMRCRSADYGCQPSAARCNRSRSEYAGAVAGEYFRADALTSSPTRLQSARRRLVVTSHEHCRSVTPAERAELPRRSVGHTDVTHEESNRICWGWAIFSVEPESATHVGVHDRCCESRWGPPRQPGRNGRLRSARDW